VGPRRVKGNGVPLARATGGRDNGGMTSESGESRAPRRSWRRTYLLAAIFLFCLPAVGGGAVWIFTESRATHRCFTKPAKEFAKPNAGTGARDFSINTLDFNSSGRSFLSGGYHPVRINLWDVETGTRLHTMEGPRQVITSVAFSPDGARCLSTSDDCTLRLWSLETGECLRTMDGGKYSFNFAVFLPDGRRCVSGGNDSTVRLWDLETGAVVLRLQGHAGPVTSVAVARDGRRVLSGSHDRTLRLWNVETGECVGTLNGHEGIVSSVIFSPDGQRCLSGSPDETIKLWDVATGECIRTMRGHTGYVSSIAAGPDGRRAASGSLDGTVRLWNLGTGEEIGRFVREGRSPGPVRSVAFAPDGPRHIARGG